MIMTCTTSLLFYSVYIICLHLYVFGHGQWPEGKIQDQEAHVPFPVPSDLTPNTNSLSRSTNNIVVAQIILLCIEATKFAKQYMLHKIHMKNKRK